MISSLVGICFLLSLLLCGGVIASARSHGRYSADTCIGPQKFHVGPTPRIGGLPIWVSMFATSASIYIAAPEGLQQAAKELLALISCSFLVFVIGLTEDITKKIGVGVRLASAVASGGLAFYVLDARIHRLDVWFLDVALHWQLFSLLMTTFAVAGISNAMNIIDGYNGLLGGYSLLALGATAFVSVAVGDVPILLGSVLLAGAIGGFLIWNFPFGRIFLGDGGAYFVGFLIAEFSVLLVHRHSEVSAWFPLMVVAYPAWETLFSVYRKKVLRNISPGQPDGLHFHMLVFKRVVRWNVLSRRERDRIFRNSLTSPYLWMLSLIPILAAVFLWDNSWGLAVLAFGFGALYNMLYRAMVRFRTPRLLIFGRRRAHSLPQGRRPQSATKMPHVEASLNEELTISLEIGHKNLIK